MRRATTCASSIRRGLSSRSHANLSWAISSSSPAVSASLNSQLERRSAVRSVATVVDVREQHRARDGSRVLEQLAREPPEPLFEGAGQNLEQEPGLRFVEQLVEQQRRHASACDHGTRSPQLRCPSRLVGGARSGRARSVRRVVGGLSCAFVIARERDPNRGAPPEPALAPPPSRLRRPAESDAALR